MYLSSLGNSFMLHTIHSIHVLTRTTEVITSSRQRIIPYAFTKFSTTQRFGIVTLSSDNQYSTTAWLTAWFSEPIAPSTMNYKVITLKEKAMFGSKYMYS